MQLFWEEDWPLRHNFHFPATLYTCAKATGMPQTGVTATTKRGLFGYGSCFRKRRIDVTPADSLLFHFTPTSTAT